MKTYYDGQIVTVGARSYRINFENDLDSGAPWKEEDGHGVISEWTTRDKRPSELVLCVDGRSKRYYDVSETIRIAKRDGWGLGNDQMKVLSEKLGRAPTQKETTAEAVRLDYEHLRGWCNDEWHWCGVIVTDVTADEDAENDYGHAVWGYNDKQGISYEVDNLIQTLQEEAKAAQEDSFITAYLTCALWSTSDDNGSPLDSNYSIGDFHPDAIDLARADCAAFRHGAGNLLSGFWNDAQAGHDLWLTRNGHGAGFWDRYLDAPESTKDRVMANGKELSAMVGYGTKYPPVDCYVGDDDKIHFL